MAKRILALLLCALMVLPLLIACDDTHTHTYADTWSSSDESHWKAATCEHEEKSEEGAHEFGDVVLSEGELCSTCSVCGFVKTEVHVHDYGEWETVTAATILADGKEQRNCKFVGCEESEERAIPRVEVASLEVTTLPSKLVYDEGNQLDLTGLTVTAIGKDGSRTDVTALSSANKSVLSIDDTAVTMTYGELSASFEIAVWSLSHHPHTFEGDWTVTTPATIFAQGQKHRVCNYAECKERELSTIPVVEILVISVTQDPIKTEYVAGEVFETQGLVVIARGVDGSRTDISALVVPNKTVLSPGDKAVVLSYKGKTTSVRVNVIGRFSVSETLNAAASTSVLVEGLFVGVADEGAGYERELILKDTQSDKLIAVHGVPYGGFPDYGYYKGDLVRLLATVTRETFVASDTKSENKTYLVFSDKNPTNVNETVVSRGNKITYALENAVLLDSWEDMQAFFQAGTLQAYTYVHIKGSVWFNTYCAASNGVPLHRICMSSSANKLSKIKPDGQRCVSMTQSMLDANVPAAMTTFFDEYIGSTDFPGNKATSIDFYAVVTETNVVNYQLTILDPSWLVDNEEKIEVKNNQDIVREMGFAFYRQGDQIYYDQRYRDENCVPESATAQQQIYLDCSSFVNSVYYEAFGINIQGVPITERSPQTGNYANYAKEHLNDPNYPDVIGYWETADYTTEDAQKALLEEVYAMLQPGDVLNYRHGKSSASSGHAMLYIGDGMFLHSTGGQATYDNADPTANQDIANPMEITHGTVQKLKASVLFTNTSSSRYLFRNDSSDKMYNFCVIRPLNRGLTPTQKTVARMAIAGLSLEKTVEPGLRAAVERGGMINYTLRIENHSSNVYTDLPFEDLLSEHLSFVGGSEGLTADGQRVSAKVSIGAFEVVTLRWSARVKETAPLGARIEGSSTTLGGFPVSIEANVVGKYTAEQLDQIAGAALAAANSGTTFTDPIAFANELYRQLVGGDLFDAQSAAALIGSCFAQRSDETFALDTDAPCGSMIVPRLYNGTKIHRLEPVTSLHRESDFMQGDLIFCEQKGVQYLYVYVGGGQFVCVTTSAKAATLVENGKEYIQRPDSTYYINSLTSQLRTYEFCVVLRPTMAS